MLHKKPKKICLFILSIPLAIVFNYVVTMQLLDFVTFVDFKGYMISLGVQVLLWFELLLFFFDKWKKTDRYLVAFLYYVILIFCLFGRSYQGTRIVNLNPFELINQFRNTHEIIIALFNIGIFIPLVIINSFFVKKGRYCFFFCFAEAFLIEGCQVLFRRGIFDICDILLYFIGILIGSMVLAYLPKEKICG